MKYLLKWPFLFAFNLFQLSFFVILINFLLNDSREFLVNLYVLFNCNLQVFTASVKNIILAAVLIVFIGLIRAYLIKRQEK